MLQKEVVDRIAAVPGTKAYGRLSIMVQYHCEVTDVLHVPPQAFEPEPKVHSAVVHLVPHRCSPFAPVVVSKLECVVARAFAMRRKTLLNNLKTWVNQEQLNELGILENTRPEQVSVEQYVQLTKMIPDELLA
jgi:16S rRNA (adenine1518-N6/adenine1519-N6)-dimethyltransferase